MDFGEPGGVYSVFIEDVADKRLDVISVISSAVPFKIVLQKKKKSLTVDLKSLRSWLVWR